jgi:hypothetical protein
MDRAIEVRSSAETKDFSSNLCVQTGSGPHPASCTKGTGVPFPGGKARPGRDANHSTPSSTEVVNDMELYLLSSQAPPWRVEGLLYCLRFFKIMKSRTLINTIQNIIIMLRIFTVTLFLYFTFWLTKGVSYYY